MMTPANCYNKPIDTLRRSLKEAGLNALLVTNEPNVQYLSDFTGDDTYLLVTQKDTFLITDFRYIEQAYAETRNWHIIRHNKGLIDKILELVKKLRIKRLGFESDSLTYNIVRDISKKLLSFTRLKPTSGLISKLRAFKDLSEIRRIRQAIACSHRAFKDIRSLIKPGISELEMAAEMEYRMRKYGASRPAFPTIVAGDQRASLPHARPTGQRLKKGGLVQFDWGACLDQYNSDTSRVLFLGPPSNFWKKIYAIVYEAQARAIEKVKPGVATFELDKAARGFISQAGYGANFGHGLGHGVGRQVHELPCLRRKAVQPKPPLSVLEPGMIFTIEPGIYLPGKGGIRIEDMVLVIEKGCEILTASIPKGLVEVII